MPEKETLKRARKAKESGKAPTTQAGEFVREEIHHVREGKHGARSPKQAIAIGLSKARRSGVDLPPPAPGQTSPRTRERAERDLRAGRKSSKRKPSPRRSRATKGALAREGRAAALPRAPAKQARKTKEARASASSRSRGATGGRRSTGGARGRSTRGSRSRGTAG